MAMCGCKTVAAGYIREMATGEREMSVPVKSGCMRLVATGEGAVYRGTTVVN